MILLFVFILFYFTLFNNFTNIRKALNEGHCQGVVHKVESLIRGSLLVEHAADIPHDVRRVAVDKDPAERRHTLV